MVKSGQLKSLEEKSRNAEVINTTSLEAHNLFCNRNINWNI